MNSSFLNEEDRYHSRIQWKKKLQKTKNAIQTLNLQRLCRAVIVKNIGLHRLRKARKELPLPHSLIDFLTSTFSLGEFEVQSLNLPRDMRVHCIYPTRCLLDNSNVTLKCIHVKACDSSPSINCLLEQWTGVNHENIMQVLVWFKDRETVGVVLEPFPKTLHALVCEYRQAGVGLSEWLLWKMLHQICDALWYLQRRQIVHTEIHSKTLSLSSSGDILLHNLLIYTPSETELNVCVDVNNSFYGICVAPERIRGQRYSHKQDSWSLGCVAYELVYLEPAFYLRAGETVFQTLNNIVNGVLPVKLGDTSSYSADVANLIISCLMAEPRLRPPIEDVFFFTRERMRSTRPS